MSQQHNNMANQNCILNSTYQNNQPFSNHLAALTYNQQQHYNTQVHQHQCDATFGGVPSIDSHVSSSGGPVANAVGTATSPSWMLNSLPTVSSNFPSHQHHHMTSYNQGLNGSTSAVFSNPLHSSLSSHHQMIIHGMQWFNMVISDEHIFLNIP